MNESIAVKSYLGNCKDNGFNQWDILQVLADMAVTCIICVFGVASNIINLLVFVRQGFKDAANVTLLGLALADIGGHLSLMYMYTCHNPLIIKLVTVLYEPNEFCGMTGGILRHAFSRTTFYFTTFITVQRCLCVAYPLKVKTLMTTKRTILTMFSISAISLLAHWFPWLSGVSYIGWETYPFTNRSLLGYVRSGDWQTFSEAVNLISITIYMISLQVIIISTVILVVQLNLKSRWLYREIASGGGRVKDYSRRDHKLGQLVAILSVVMIVCYLPMSCGTVWNICLPSVTDTQMTDFVYILLWNVSFISEAINSGVNICIYYKVSSKYRSSFHSVVCVHRHVNT